MSVILHFLRGGKGAGGLTLSDMLDMDDAAFELSHTHIQWMFPLPEESKAQPSSPVAALSDYDDIAASPVLRARMLASLGRFILFLDRTIAWRQAVDHNHLRITRAIRCLGWCGLNDVAYDFVEYVTGEVGSIVPQKTVWYWEEALRRDPGWLQTERR